MAIQSSPSSNNNNSPTNLISYFRRFFIPKKDVNGNYGPSSKLYPFSIGTLLNIWPSHDLNKAIDLGFVSNGTVFSVIRDSGRKFGSIPRFLQVDALTSAIQKRSRAVYSRTKAASPYANQVPNMNDKRIVGLNKLLNRPNEFQSQDALYDQLFESFLLMGESYVWCNRGFQVNKDFQYIDDKGNVLTDQQLDQMPVLEMYWIPSNFLTLMPDPNNPFDVQGWALIYFGFQAWLRKQDVIQWKNNSLLFDPVTRPHLRGMTPLRPGGAILQANNSAILSTTRTLQNNGAYGLLTYDDSNFAVSPGQMDEVREKLRSTVNSGDVGGSIAALAGSWEYTNFNKSQTLPYIDAMRYSDQQICMLFQYPYELINPTTTFANKESAKKNWINDTIIPACKQLDGEFNRVLLKGFGLRGVVTITSDYHSLPELQDDMGKLTLSLSQSWWLSPNQKLQAQGYDPIDNPLMNEIFVPIGMTPMSAISQDMTDLSTPIEDDNSEEDDDDGISSNDEEDLTDES
jgi:phage portal protein BeeE